MSDNKEIKYPLKSEKYKGVFQRKNGSWFYRIKKILAEGEEPWVYQESNFKSDKEAYIARRIAISNKQLELGRRSESSTFNPITFGEVFDKFICDCKSETSKKKYQDLYNAHLIKWEDRPMFSVSDSDIDILLLKIGIKKQNNGKFYSSNYQASIRKLIKKIFKYANTINASISANVGQNLSTKPYKLRVLSLFSGIGAPEQALKNMGIDYELVGFCEIDPKPAKAYCLFHKGEETYEEYMKKNLWDVRKVTQKILLEELDDFDIMIFGFPCTDISKLGKQKGLSDKLPSDIKIFWGEYGEITRSGLFYEAFRIALHYRPKFMIAENVGELLGKKFKKDFKHMLELLSAADYTIHYIKLNSKDFGLPQNRPRIFMVMIRGDIKIDYKFPKPIPLTVKAADWFETEVDEEYYVKPEKWEKMNNYNSHKPQTKENDYIGCITTKWGSISNSGQKFIKVGDRYRIMTSEELMKFQGFPPEYGTLLRQNGFSKDQVGKLVGNSISVPVMEAIIKSLIDCM